MKFSFQNGATAEIRFNTSGQPLVALQDVPGLPGTSEFFATAWLDAAATCSRFSVAGGFADDPVVTFSAIEVAGAAEWIREQVKPTTGAFVTAFVPADPSEPF